jgi:hypothetical protein
MNDRPPRVYTYRGKVPLWLVLAVVAPLGLVFLTSLILAVAIVAAGAALVAFLLPSFLRRSVGQDSSNTIELDTTQYRHIESRPPRDRH